MGTITSSLAGQLDLSGITITNVSMANVSIASSGTEYSYTFPTGTKGFAFQNRQDGIVKFSFTASESGTKYWTLYPGQPFSKEFISSSASLTLYFQSTKASQTLEVVSWN